MPIQGRKGRLGRNWEEEYILVCSYTERRMAGSVRRHTADEVSSNRKELTLGDEGMRRKRVRRF